MILLDTNIVIAYLNGSKTLSDRIKRNIDKIALSALVAAELDYGAKASQQSARNHERLHRLLDIIQIVPFDIRCAEAFGTIKSRLRAIGKPTGEVGALIAATAIAHKAVLVTANKRHFENIEGLRIETWPEE